jgi:hypothetical protein
VSGFENNFANKRDLRVSFYQNTFVSPLNLPSTIRHSCKPIVLILTRTQHLACCPSTAASTINFREVLELLV